MDYKEINRWLMKHEIMLEESFVTSLKNLAKTFKKKWLFFAGRCICRTGMQKD